MSPTTPTYSEKPIESLTYTSPLPVSFKTSRQQQFIENLFAKITTPSLDMESPEQLPLSTRNIQVDSSLLPPPRIQPNYSQNYYAEIEINPHPAPTIETSLQQEASPIRNSSSTDSRIDKECSPMNSSDDEYSSIYTPSPENHCVGEEGSPINSSDDPEYYMHNPFPRAHRTDEDYFSSDIYMKADDDTYAIDLDNRIERFNVFKKYLFQFVEQNPNSNQNITDDLKRYIASDVSETIEEQNHVISVFFQNINIQGRDADKNTLVHMMIESGFVEAIKLLNDCRPVDLWTLINQKNNDGDTPLHIATKKQFTKGIEVLAHYNASINTRNALTGDTALLMAVKSRFVEGIQTLIAYGAKTDLANFQGISPWMAIQDESVIKAFGVF